MWTDGWTDRQAHTHEEADRCFVILRSRLKACSESNSRSAGTEILRL